MMKKTKILSLASLLLVLVCALTAFTFTACGGSKVKITLSRTEVTVAEGGTANIVATVKGSTEQLEWKIDNTEVAEISVIGGKVCNVNAKKVGNAKVTATIGKVSAECRVTVVEDNTEKVTITLEGVEVTEHEMNMNTEVTFAATASNGSAITWESSNENIATVENGLVKALRPGNVTIAAKVTASIKAEVALTVKSVDGYEYYDITLKNGAADAAANPGKWAYWTEWAQFTTLNYDNGTVNLEFTENGGQWYNIQLFNNNPTVVAAKYYKLTCDIDSSAAGHVTINGNVIAIEEGKHSYEIYFTNGTGFSMQFGVEGSGIDIPVGKVSISNIVYTEDTSRVTLLAPSFTFDAETSIVTITDGNTAGVKNYVISFYQNDKKITGVTVAKSGDKLDLTKIANGEYDAKIQAVALNAHYIDSDESADAVKITVNNEGGITYSFHNAEGDSNNTEMDGNGIKAIAQAGIWTYWCSSWVNMDGLFADDKLTVEFSNNAGNWYDTQLFYKVPALENGKIYSLILAIDSNASGRVTLNGSEFAIQEDAHDYEIVFTAGDGLSLQFTFGLNGQSNNQEIKAGKLVFEIKSVEEVSVTKLSAPSFTYDAETKKITITDDNTAGVGSYQLGFFNSDATEPVAGVTVTNGGVVELPAIKNGTYTVKLMAKAINAKYVDSSWSESTAEIEIVSDKTNISYGGETALTSGWCYWNDGSVTVNEGDCYMDSEGNIHLTYSGSGPWYGMQLFYKDGLSGQPHKLTLKLNSTAEGKITVNGKVIELVAGDNDITVDNYGGSSISIQFGVVDATMIAGGTFVLSDISVTAVA